MHIWKTRFADIAVKNKIINLTSMRVFELHPLRFQSQILSSELTPRGQIMISLIA